MDKSRTLRKPLLDFADRREEDLKQQVLSILEAPELSVEQRQTLKTYYNYTLGATTRTLKESTLFSTFDILCKWGKTLQKPYEAVSQEDIGNYITQLKDRNKPSYICLVMAKLKQFYRYLNNGELPAFLKAYKTNIKREDRTEAELITPSDVKKLVDCCKTERDACLVMMLWESAARLNEVLSLKLKHVTSDDYGFKINIDKSKTKRRTIRLIDSDPYLRKWLNNHPIKDPEAYVFVSLRRGFGGKLNHSSVEGLITRLGKQAGLTKRVHPHLFRASRLTNLYQQGFNERDLMLIAGWNSTAMAQIYCTYGQEEVDRKLLKNRGLLKEEDSKQRAKENKTLEPKTCPRCEKINIATALYCNCGMALDIKTIVKDLERREKADGVMDDLFADDEFKKLIKEFLESKKKGGKGE